MPEITEKPSDSENDTRALAARWIQELKLYEKEFKRWDKRVYKVSAKYAAEAKGSGDDSDFLGDSGSSFNIFWSNINVLGPALYARQPVVQIERRHKDKDVLSRLTSQTWERATAFEAKNEDFSGIMNEVVLDYLIGARGTSRIRFDVELAKTFDEMTGQEVEQIIKEGVPTEYVYPKDFRHQPGRTWEEVEWVAFRSYLNRDQLNERGFPEDLPLSHKPKGVDEDRPEHAEKFGKAVIWEVWDKATKRVYWLCEGYDKLCDAKDDPYGLSGFFPCPKPLYATRKRGSLIPVPDYDICQAQYKELDGLSQRIRLLTSSLRVAGVYDASMTELDRLVSESTENRLIPVQNWAFLMEKGGIDGVISWLPIQQIAEVLIRLYEARDRTLSEIYEITGLSDIVRGNSNANETATAQQIKGNFATLRLQSRQQDVQRFARDLLAMKAEIIAEHFQPETIRRISGFDQIAEVNPEDPAQFEAVIQLLRDDPSRTYKIEIETDSTIAIDEQAAKEKANEYLAAVGGFMQQVLSVAQVAPEFMLFMGETLKYTARQYRAGRSLEGVLEQSIDQFQQALLQPPPEQPPDPKMVEVQQKGELEQQKLALEQQKIGGDQAMQIQELQFKLAELQLQLQMKDAQIQATAAQHQFTTMQSEAAEAPEPAPQAQPITLNLNVTPGRKKVILGPIDPLTGMRTGEVIEEPNEEPMIPGVIGG